MRVNLMSNSIKQVFQTNRNEKHWQFSFMQPSCNEIQISIKESVLCKYKLRELPSLNLRTDTTN